MAIDHALLEGAFASVLAGTAFDGGRDECAHSTGNPFLFRCAPTPRVRELHPRATAALDAEHPDGCTDLTVAVDDRGRLERADLELLEIAPDLIGRPALEVLPELVERLRRLLAGARPSQAQSVRARSISATRKASSRDCTRLSRGSQTDS